MEEMILEEVKRDVFDNPKPTIDLDYLYSIKKQIQEFADDTNSKLKKNVYQNYSLFIESSREISILKEEMKQLNILLEQQQTSMNKLLEQLNKTPIIQPTVERQKEYVYIIPNATDRSSDSESLPSWYTKSPEDFDVLIAQRNLKEAVELCKKIKSHEEQYPVLTNRAEPRAKIMARIKELINAICSELQPATDRTVQGGPRSSIGSIQLLRELNLSSRAVHLYLDQRSSVLRFVLEQQKVESTTTLQFIKQLCSIFFHSIIETCSEFKQAFEIDINVTNAINESRYMLDTNVEKQDLLFDSVSSIYLSPHPTSENGSPSTSNNNDITSRLFDQSNDKALESPAGRNKNVFHYLSTYASLTSWIVQEFEHLTHLFKKLVFNNQQLSVSMIAESVYYLKSQCTRVAKYCELDMSELVERELAESINQVIDDSGRKLIATIKKLDSEEQWQPQQFQNKAQLTRFLEEMSDVGLKTMPHYIHEDLKLPFTACKTSFARCYLITVNDLAKLVNKTNKERIDSALARTFELELESIIDALKKIKVTSKVRFIMNNSNFLLDKVIVEAQKQYTGITNSECTQLVQLLDKYYARIKSMAKI